MSASSTTAFHPAAGGSIPEQIVPAAAPALAGGAPPAASAQAIDARMAALGNHVAELVIAAIQPFNDSLINAIQAMQVAVQRAEAAVIAAGAGSHGSSRTPRASSASGGSSSSSSSKAGPIDVGRVTNARLYFRMRYIQEEETRQNYRRPRDGMTVEADVFFNTLTLDQKIVSKPAGSWEFYAAEALAIWGMLGPADTKDLKSQFSSWKESNVASASLAPLAADRGANYAPAPAAGPIALEALLASAAQPPAAGDAADTDPF